MSEGLLQKDKGQKQEMTSSEVVSVYSGLENAGIKIWIDGGWSVDALIGKQIRPHNDLDIAVQWKDTPRLREILEAKGYVRQIRVDSRWNWVVGDDKGHEIDIHAFIYDDQGKNIINGIMYPADSLSGTGTIEGLTVRCISAEYMVKALAQYISKHPHKYLQAVSELCKKFGIDLPEEYTNYKKLS